MISDASGDGKEEAEVGATGATASQGKVSKGKTGVEFCFYKRQEYQALSAEQKKELALWRKKNSGKGKASAKSTQTEKTMLKSMIAAMVKQKLANIEKEKADEEQAKTGLKDFILEHCPWSSRRRWQMG